MSVYELPFEMPPDAFTIFGFTILLRVFSFVIDAVSVETGD